MTQCSETYRISGLKAFADNYIWVIHPVADCEPVQRSAVVVDPGDAGPVIAFCEQHCLSLAGVLLTHHHADHTGGLAELLAWADLQHPGKPVAVYGSQEESIAGVSRPLAGGDRVEVLPGCDMDVLAVPGHTRGHLAFVLDAGSAGETSVFCGDVLFGLGCGRIFEGTAAQMFDSLQAIARLPEQTKVYCAHEYTLLNLPFALAVDPENSALLERAGQIRSRRAAGLPTVPLALGEELRTNPFLRCTDPAIVRAAGSGLSARPAEVFRALRLQRDNFRSAN